MNCENVNKVNLKENDLQKPILIHCLYLVNIKHRMCPGKHPVQLILGIMHIYIYIYIWFRICHLNFNLPFEFVFSLG